VCGGCTQDRLEISVAIWRCVKTGLPGGRRFWHKSTISGLKLGRLTYDIPLNMISRKRKSGKCAGSVIKQKIEGNLEYTREFLRCSMLATGA
jgi:hypothetical protein